MFNIFPYTNFHALNLDWIVNRFQRMILSINGHSPDNTGNITLTGAELGAVGTVDGIAPDSNGNVALGAIRKVNGFSPIGTDGNIEAGTIRSVNGKSPSSLPTPGAITLTARDIGAVGSVNSIAPDANGNVNVGTVKSVNNQTPDSNGNVNLSQVSGVTSVNGIGADGAGNVTLTASDVGAIPDTVDPVKSVNNVSPDNTGNVTLTASDVGAIPDTVDPVKSVNNVSPDNTGNVTLTASDVGAVKRYTTHGTVTWDQTNTDPTYTNIDSHWFVMDNICFVNLRFQAAIALSGGMILASGLPVRATDSVGYMTGFSTNGNSVGRVQAAMNGNLTMAYSGSFAANEIVLINGCYPVDPTNH